MSSGNNVAPHSRSVHPQSAVENSQGSDQSNSASAAAAAAAAAAANTYASTFRNINGLHPYASYEAAAAAAAACAWAGRLDPSSASLGRLDAASAANFHSGLAASQAAFRRSGKCCPLVPQTIMASPILMQSEQLN